MNFIRISSFIGLWMYTILVSDRLYDLESLCAYLIPAFAGFAVLNLLVHLIEVHQQTERRNEIYNRVMEQRRQRLMRLHREERRSQFSCTERKAG